MPVDFQKYSVLLSRSVKGLYIYLKLTLTIENKRIIYGLKKAASVHICLITMSKIIILHIGTFSDNLRIW